MFFFSMIRKPAAWTLPLLAAVSLTAAETKPAKQTCDAELFTEQL